MMIVNGVFKLAYFFPPSSTTIKWLSIFLSFLVYDSLQRSIEDDSMSSPSKSKNFLRNFKITHMNSISSQTLCPEESNTYVVAARVRLSTHLNQSKPLVTALEVFCSDGIRTRVKGRPTLLIDKNIGEWSEVKECPNGLFVTDVVFNLEYFITSGLIAFNLARSFYNSPDRMGYSQKSTGLDVRYISKDKYVAGITMNCSYRGNNRNFFPTADEQDENKLDDYDGAEQSKKGAEWSSFTLGESTGYGLRIYCLRDRVISGIFVKKQALVSSNDGERMLPVKLTIKCEELFNPARDCHPELGWEKIENDSLHCLDSDTGLHLNSSVITDGDPHPPNVYCRVRHSIGSALNQKITNLNRIIAAYKPLGLADNIGVLLVPKLLSPHFRTEWQQNYKLSFAMYEKVIHDQPFEKYLHLHKNQVTTIGFRNITYELPEGSNNFSQRVAGNRSMNHELTISQLVGYCSIYQINFPVFKFEMQQFVQETIDGLERDIVFERVKN